MNWIDILIALWVGLCVGVVLSGLFFPCDHEQELQDAWLAGLDEGRRQKEGGHR